MKTKEQRKIGINLAIVIFFLIGLMIGCLIGMEVQNVVLAELIGELLEKIRIENVYFNFNQTKLVQDLLVIYNGTS